jgi:predicted DCC family thiol-disulfide oxidoreductase YuxK
MSESESGSESESESESGSGSASLSPFDVEVFFDGACPLCMREITMLRKLDTQTRIRFTDIADPMFDPATVGLTMDDLMQRIRARLPSGELIDGVEVFRRLYAAVGFGRVVAMTRLPGISGMLDLGYELFAKNRLRLTGRCANDVCEVTSPPGRPAAS